MKSTAPAKKYRFGNAFKNGKLYLFQADALVVIRGWPEMRAWRKTPVRPSWMHVRPEMQLIPANGIFQIAMRSSDWLASVCASAPAKPPQEAIESWLESRSEDSLNQLTVPFRDVDPDDVGTHPLGKELLRLDCARLLQFLAPFPSDVLAAIYPFSQRQWHLAAFCARVPGALRLLQSNPALAFCLASNASFRTPLAAQPLRDARRWIKKTRSKIARWLGFPSAQSSVAILAKIPADACDVALLKQLRCTLQNTAVKKVLQHVKSISALALAVCTQPRLKVMLSAHALTQFCALDTAQQREYFELTRMAARVYSMNANPGRSSPWYPFASLAALARKRNAIASAYAARFAKIAAGGSNADSKSLDDDWTRFTQNHLPAWLQELTSAAQLDQEAQEMRHCIKAYQLRLRAGSARAFRVYAPERCTVLMTQAGRLEIAGPNNLAVQPETRQAINAALRAHELFGGANSQAKQSHQP